MAISFDPDNIVYREGPLFQIINNQLYQLMPETYATQVKLADGTDADTHISTLETNYTALNATVANFLTGTADNPVGTLDKLSELVAAIEANKDLIDTLQTDYVPRDEIVDDLTSDGVTDKPLSANQGYQLKQMIDAITGATPTAATGYVTVAPSDAGFTAAVEALNLADGAIFTAIA